MKIFLKDLMNISDEKVYTVSLKNIEIENNIFLRRITNVEGDLVFYYNESARLVIDYSIQGQMVCPDAYTLEDVEVEFDLQDAEEVTFDENKEGFLLRGDSELSEVVKTIILPEVPIKVVKNPKIEYSIEDSWIIDSEEETSDSSKSYVDSRWDKLKELISEEED